MRVGVHADERLTAQIFEGVGHETILAEGYDDVLGAENEIGQHGALDDLHTRKSREDLPRLCDGRLVRSIFVFVIGEVAAQPAHVELRLHFGREPRLEVCQARGAYHQNDFVFGQPHKIVSELVSNFTKNFTTATAKFIVRPCILIANSRLFIGFVCFTHLLTHSFTH